MQCDAWYIYSASDENEYSAKTTSPATIHTHECVALPEHSELIWRYIINIISVTVLVRTFGENTRTVTIDILKY